LSVEFDRLLDALLAFPKPLLAAVNGVAVGFGMTMLLHCDLVLVDDDARLRTPFTEMQLAPEAGSSWLLPRAVGAQAAAFLLLTSEGIDGREAERIGLAWRCCRAGTVLDETMAIARRLASLPLAPLVATKRLLRETNADAIADAFVRERDAMASIDRSSAS
jgi:enoyl-CoA hydratase/carnithine racemase